MYINNEELEIKLLRGSSITIDGIIIKPLLLHEIIDNIGYEKYFQLLGVVAIDKIRITELPQEVLKDIVTFDIFLADEKLIDLLVDFLRTFLKYENIFYIPENQSILFDYDTNIAWLNRYNYDEFVNILRKMYCVKIEKEEEYKPYNDKARELIEKIKKKNAELAKVKSKTEINLISIISGVAWKSSNTNIFEVFNLTIYQLYDAYYRLEIVDNYNNTMMGIYSGTVDSKKIDFKQLTWVKRVNTLDE